jgi:hypothetical protein
VQHLLANTATTYATATAATAAAATAAAVYLLAAIARCAAVKPVKIAAFTGTARASDGKYPLQNALIPPSALVFVKQSMIPCCMHTSSARSGQCECAEYQLALACEHSQMERVQ